MALGKHYSNVIDIFFEKMIHILQLKKSWKLSQFANFWFFGDINLELLGHPKQ